MASTAQKFDAIIVGAGQRSPLAGRLTAAGQTVAVIERKLVGGTCVNRLHPHQDAVASAHAAQTARRGAEYGVGTGELTVDIQKVKARKDRIMLDDRHGVESWLEGMDNCTLIRGHARFEDAHTIRVHDQVLQADRIFLNVGGRAVVTDMPGLADIDYTDQRGNPRPRHPARASRHHRWRAASRWSSPRCTGASAPASRSSKRPRPPPVRTRTYRRPSRRSSKRGIAIELGATAISVRKRDNGFEVIPRVGADPIAGSHLLMAIGRRPNTDDLGLENAGVQTDTRGHVIVDDQCRTNVEHIWAMGDCNGRGAFTHTSYNDFEIVAANLLDDDPRRVSDRVPTYALYIDPPLGRAGMTVDQVRKSGRKALVGKRLMTRVGRAVEKGETQGFMKVVVDAETKKILGAAILGVGGDEVVHAILDIMTAKEPYTAISRTMHIHPTVSELVTTLLQEMKPLD
jgi:pyruvate/2-oxoglutarate dehydrogenase complex dihydrolipoamide dehydrogenase (E3) component